VISPARIHTAKLQLYSTILSIRPAQLASCVKWFCGISRVSATGPDHTTFHVDPVSIFGLRLLRDGVHEPALSDFVLKLLRSDDVFVDVGGNEGYFSVLAARRVGERGTVLCIEPQTRLLPVIQENARLNGVQCIRICPLAIAEQETEVTLYLRPSTNTGASSFHRHWKLGGASEKVKTQTLTALLDQHGINRVRLLKLDCEGAEPLVIRGALAALKQHRIDFLSMDYHVSISGEDACRNTHRTLINCGYRAAVLDGVLAYYSPNTHSEITQHRVSQIPGWLG
jgi:FkbM family methyltransferase